MCFFVFVSVFLTLSLTDRNGLTEVLLGQVEHFSRMPLFRLRQSVSKPKLNGIGDSRRVFSSSELRKDTHDIPSNIYSRLCLHRS